MFVSSSLAQPIVTLFFALPFNNLLHNLLLQIVRASAAALPPCALVPLPIDNVLIACRCLAANLSQVRTSVHEVVSPENIDLVKSILVDGKLCENIVRAFEGYVR